MHPPLAPAGAPAKPNTAWIIAGIVFILIWLGAHYILYILSGAGGIVAELLLTILRGTQLPGTMNPARPMQAWIPFLQTAVLLSGSAGVLAGLAFFWRTRRRLLLILAPVLFLLALPVGGYAIYVLLADSLLP